MKEKLQSLTSSLVWLLPLIVFCSLPTKTYGNVGFVDPNLYIGKALGTSWFYTNLDLEYHGTRLPFVYLLKGILSAPDVLVGPIFKLLTMSSILLFWIGLCKKIMLNKKLCLLGSILVLGNPLTISATSWTTEQPFSLSLIAIITYLTLRLSNAAFYLWIGVCLVILGNSNMYFLGFCILLISPTLIVNLMTSDRISRIRKLSYLLAGVVSSIFTIEVLWRLNSKNSSRFWIEEHAQVIARGSFGSTKGFGEWRGIKEIFLSNPGLLICLAFATTALLFMIFPKPVETTKQFTKFEVQLLIGSLLAHTFSWATYIAGINPLFDSFWYFYPNLLPIIIQGAILLRTMEEDFGDKTIEGITILFSLTFFYAILYIIDGMKPRVVLIFALAVAFALVLHLKIEKNQIKKNRKTIFIFSMLAASSISLFLSPPLFNSYQKIGGIEINLLVDQRKLMNFVKDDRGSVATWAPSDPEGYLGSLISTLGFHLTRLEGVDASKGSPELLDWYTSHGERLPKYLLLLLPSDYQVEISQLEKCQYQKIDRLKLKDGAIAVEKYEIYNGTDLKSVLPSECLKSISNRIAEK